MTYVPCLCVCVCVFVCVNTLSLCREFSVLDHKMGTFFVVRPSYMAGFTDPYNLKGVFQRCYVNSRCEKEANIQVAAGNFCNEQAN